MTPRSQPPCETLPKWLRANGYNLGALTGTDAKALAAAVHIVELIAYTGLKDSLVAAFGLVVLQMQPSTRVLAYQAIAHVMDWGDRDRLWRAAGFQVSRASISVEDPPVPLLEYVQAAYAGAGVSSDRLCVCDLHGAKHEAACPCWCHE